MGIKLLDVIEARMSTNSVLVVPCQGKKPDGSPHCCGCIRIPFTPPIPGHELQPAERHWTRNSGESLADIDLSPSIDAGECGHFHIRDGEITD